MESVMKKFLKPKDIFAYSLGLFGFQFIVGFLNSYQAEFYSGVMAADFAIIGILLLVVKAVSAIFDPFVGTMIERMNSKHGKLKPFIIYSAIPLLLLTVLLFVEVNLRGTWLYVYIFGTFLLWSIAMTLGDVPSQALASVLTPNPEEKTNVISLANTFKSIGLVACVAVVPIICMIVPNGSPGFTEGDPIASIEYFIASVIIGFLGCGLFLLIFFFNKERVPYKVEKASFKDMTNAVKGNKPLILVLISCFLGFGRQIQTGIGIQAANVLVGSQNLALVLGITAGIGALVSMSLMPVLIKKFNEKKVYIGVSIYGFVVSLITFLVGSSNIYVMLVLLFLVGLQFGVVNILPMVMVADSVDYYEYKTGKRNEGAAYAVLSLTIKLTLALSTALGLIMLSVAKYDPNVSANDTTKKLVYFAYSFFPGLFSLLSIIPIFKYNLVGKRKTEIAEALQKRRMELSSASDTNGSTSDSSNSELSSDNSEIRNDDSNQNGDS
ncbi:MAG: glycoside-pentoside-hexuronide (GPH):cation symporter [Christensenellaceae bacterium]|jgi:GPH family glycoside/pentoside/hexuronide:cation symporter|nr:glycoside-pentoside-hexuronide (GPH):cation symporter [Christensenellaceae bacterium]